MPSQNIQHQAEIEWSEFTRPDRIRILVGAATCGRAAGALQVIEAFQEELGRIGLLDSVNLAQVGCLGLCYAEPLVETQDRNGRRFLYGSVEPRHAAKIVESHLVRGEPLMTHVIAVMAGDPPKGAPRFSDLPMMRGQVRVILRNCGVIDPTNVFHYIALGGYSGLSRAVAMSPEDVLEEIKSSGLRGRGGAGFPTGLKWSFARKSPGEEKYVVCNADEGDPGAFMNRSVLESDPHAVLEGLAIAGYAIGAQTGIVYVRAEYPLAIERLQLALQQMREQGFLGSDILGSGFEFDIRIKKGAGAFVCGEETALIASVEGRRGMPRSRPPFPAVAGLFGKPTNINNVETLAAASVIMERGADWYAQFGSEKSKGTKTFSLAGKIERTGLIEVPLGTPLRTIIEKIGGGVLDRKKFKAVQTGGPSGGCVPESLLDTPVDYERLAEIGSIMGSGGIVVMDEDSCMVDVARYFLGFTESESCGKCVPCRMGTQHLRRILTEITEGRGTPDHLVQMQRIGQTMKLASLCGLGQTAPNPVLTTLRHFEEEYRGHIRNQTCLAGACREMVCFEVDAEKCSGCMVCERNCPVDAIRGGKREVHWIDQEVCIRCGACRSSCRFDAIRVAKRSQPQPLSVSLQA